MAEDDFDVTAGWGHFGSGQAVMPGQGRVVERPYTTDERAYWRNVPANVWGYKLGGYQVLKKWLSYRESKVLGRELRPEEVEHFMEVGRRVATLIRYTV